MQWDVNVYSMCKNPVIEGTELRLDTRELLYFVRAWEESFYLVIWHRKPLQGPGVTNLLSGRGGLVLSLYMEPPH